MIAAWTGPPIGVMRPGMLAVSGCRPPAEYSARSYEIWRQIRADVRSHIIELACLIIVHGGAQGVDSEAATFAEREERHVPDYARYGLAAPKIRNVYVTTTERFCAWPAPWSRGTWDAIKQRLEACGAAGFEVRMIEDYRPAWVRALMDRKVATWTRIG